MGIGGGGDDDDGVIWTSTKVRVGEVGKHGIGIATGRLSKMQLVLTM